MNLSLSGIRVVDLTTNVSGPMATQILGDLGADVVKVERPGGDDTRGWGPPFWGDRVESGTFASLNRNKRSVVLDLKTDEGRSHLGALLDDADVLVQNMRPGALSAMGFDWASLRQAHPRLIFCEISGFGSEGPRASEPAYDPLMQAYSGLMSLTGEAGGPPARIPVSILDKGTGMWATIGILHALLVRQQTGRGQLVQTSLLDTALTWLPTQIMGYLADGDLPERLGSGAQGIAPYQAFPASDGYLIIAAGNQRLWERLCQAMERGDLVEDARFVTNADRFNHREALETELTATLAAGTVEHWVATLAKADIPVTPINEIDAVVSDPQVQALGSLVPVEHPDVDGYTLVSTPIVADGERFPIRQRPPRLGEHTESVLGSLSGSVEPAGVVGVTAVGAEEETRA